jgi:hypothetical protein
MVATETSSGIVIRHGDKVYSPGGTWTDLESCRYSFNSHEAAELVIRELQAREADADPKAAAKVAGKKQTKPVRGVAPVQETPRDFMGSSKGSERV